LSAVFGCAKKNLVFDESSRPVIAAENVVVCTARSQIGTRYKNGGASPDTGFDCSGFVAWVYGRHGVSIPRTTEAQAQAGRAVPPSRMRPGDLVVFIISRQQGMHTGIYSGDGKFIHSPSSGKSVREESVHSSYWKQRLLSARRILR
jgi:cell wall-associated NlpC family hydrolase